MTQTNPSPPEEEIPSEDTTQANNAFYKPEESDHKKKPSFFRLPEDLASQARNAIRAITLFLILSLGVLGFLTFQAARTPSPQLWSIVFAVIIIDACMFAGLVVARRGQHERGIFLAFVPWLLLLVFIVAFVSGLGFAFMAVALSVITLISGLSLPSRQAMRLNIFGAVTAIIILLVDVFITTERIAIPGFDTVAFVVIATMVLVFGYATVRQFGNYSLRAKLLVAFISVTVVATGALGIFVVNNTTNILQENLGRELSEAANSRALRVGGLFNEQIDQLTILTQDDVLRESVEEQNRSYEGGAAAIQAVLDTRDAQWRAADEADNNNDPLVRENLTNAVAKDMTEYRAAFPDNIEVFVTDVFGGLAGSTNRTSDYFQADEGWWQAAYANGAGAVYIGEPEYDESADAIGVNIALPIRNRETGKIIGILRTTYVVSALSSILQGEYGQTGELDIIIPGETASRIDYFGELEPIEPEEFEKVQSIAYKEMVEMEYEGNFSVVTQAPVQTLEGNPDVDNLGWVIAFSQHRDEAFAPLNAQLQGTILVMVFVIAFATAAAYYIAQLLVSPILQLTSTAEEVSAGDLNSRAEITSTDEVGTLATVFNNMTSQLQDTLQGLEQRVADRTKALETSTEVSRRLSTILDQDVLVREVVEQLVTAFDYYYAHIYTLDEAKETLIMRGGTGEAGQTMLARGHTIPVGSGMVGRAAASNQVVLAPDTSQEEGWLPNELLPETRSEISVPIAVGDEVLGVFDVQHNVVDGLTEEDAGLMQSIANQVAIALQNAGVYVEAQRRADREAMIGNIGQKIQSATTIEDALQVAVRELGRALKAEHSTVQLSLQESGNGQEE